MASFVLPRRYIGVAADRDISIVQSLVSCHGTLPVDLSPPDARLIGHRAVLLLISSANSLS
jgi:hypothetical protein